MPAYNDNVCLLTTTMYACMQRQCMLAYNDNVCLHTIISDACVGVPPTPASGRLRRLRRSLHNASVL
ncbi:MAG: hypothetical protein LBS54_00340 [Dysgonamonadaceae bacterium]|nr:hypothetical protein [Dysgonamonadaceae bacterium]